ncbi:uncharacterized protein HMPREF1541_05269 [Cyphellophora europaea CBS 101466]|uniref:Amino acid permease/ SLC12A domain-containing protein n=1 Tax=Cyphellophora europaea (strain CBS 101466) TaxID=1220924 RepID=W2RRG1_CYPE1|nr:uncharacterized protein HMPREF1541_05269 [Cyphellophora europaea CBS 101466]ETN39047.1 hypothetical protein HMPREF1541_05269 [Cyphellophora europaea CBS 101466]
MDRLEIQTSGKPTEATTKNADVEMSTVLTEHSGTIESINPYGAQLRQPLQKNFSIISLSGIGLVVGNVWPALAGSLATSIFNGGPSGAIYEFFAASLCYFAVAAVIAELASSLPSSAGVHLWASVMSGPKYGRLVGYLAGYWNCFAWIFAAASVSAIASNLCLEIHAYLHPEFEVKRWHTLLGYLLLNWVACGLVTMANKAVPRLNIVGLLVLLIGGIATIVVCAAMLDTNAASAKHQSVWASWEAHIGYPDGFVFVAGMLNGAFAMGTPDATTHLAEEIPNPEINVPKAIASQYLLGFVSAFAYLITILYSITDYDALLSASFPIAEIYSQATRRSDAGTTVLMVLILLSMILCTISLHITFGRTLWTLARVNATPFPKTLGRVSTSKHMPVAATVTGTVVVSLIGIIYLFSSSAFNSFVASFILLSSSSYIAVAVPYLAQRSSKKVEPGPFFIKGVFGYAVHFLACAYMVVWFVIYCFPYSLPTDAVSMNYTSLIWGGITIFAGVWWVFDARKRCVWPARITDD